MHKRLLSVLIALCLLTGLRPFARAEGLASAPLQAGNIQNGMVRVRLSSLGAFSTLNLTVLGSYTINGQSAQEIGGGASATVQFNSATGQWTLKVGGTSRNMGTSFRLCRHETSGQNGIKIAQGRSPGNLYPGDFQFIARGGSGSYTPWVVAHIYMEDYLYGVLPYEMGNSSGMEALKAQAVAARTYTMRAMSGAASALYDVVDTTADQVYSGTPSGSANCKAAVDATKGIVLKNGSSFTATYYTASNGGQTEIPKNAWGSGGPSYLAVKDDPYDLANPDSRKVSFFVKSQGAQSSATLGRLLDQKAAAKFGAGASVTGVSSVTPHTPKYAAPSRAYTKLDFAVSYTRNGETGFGTLTFDIFSELEGPLGMNITTASCELWSVTQASGGFTVTARRYGHGIGMSQRGVLYMAQMGYAYDQILAFYFEGCTRVEYTLTRSILSPVVDGQYTQQVIPETPAALTTPAPEQAEAVYAWVNTVNGSLNLRESPRDNAKVLRTIPKGERVPVYERGASWCKTAYGGNTGYVMTKFLSFSAAPALTPTPAPSASAASASAQVTTVSGSLNLREKADSAARVLCTIPQYTILPVLESGGVWCKTVYGGYSGYVMTRYLTFLSGTGVSPASTPAPTPAPVQTPAPSSGLTAWVETPGGSLNLRKEARDSAKVLRTIPQGDAVSVLQRGDTWCQVAYNGQTGYVMTRYLRFGETAAPTPAPHAGEEDLRVLDQPIVGRVMSTSRSLNLRQACSTDAKVLTEMPRFDSLLITAVGDTWCAVEYEGLSGYCMTKYLEFDLYE